MIPVDHGQPYLGLIPLVRLWRCKNRQGYCGSPNGYWWTYVFPNLYRNREEEGEWIIMEGKSGCSPAKRTDLFWIELPNGTPALRGSFGIAQAFVLPNPFRKGLGDLTLYVALTLYPEIEPMI